MPSANPTTVQTENNNFVALTNALLANTADMVGTESKAQLLLKFRFAMHLLTFVNEDSRLLILKLASIVAGLRCSPTPCLSSRFSLQRNCFFCSDAPRRSALPSRNTFCAALTEQDFPDVVGPLVLEAMNNNVQPDFTLPRFYVANLIDGMRQRLEVSARVITRTSLQPQSRGILARTTRPYASGPLSAGCAVDGCCHQSRGAPQDKCACAPGRAPGCVA